jgi:hypothetical protein
MQAGYWRSNVVGGHIHRPQFGTEDGSTVLSPRRYPSRQQHYDQEVSSVVAGNLKMADL